ncbi:hypothetical protein PR202_ga30570 [Eleusine coracana subsp. coracana]|uniref:Uncharacterized protein n=1 Tax=Eleusine coracana subsp. coracana TaxID=191504 RepID=A0AAV5DP93_ELECO|nr:hypothetical protein PR202_ga30570 [Eleusine coracana subsp. coracana]
MGLSSERACGRSCACLRSFLPLFSLLSRVAAKQIEWSGAEELDVSDGELYGDPVGPLAGVRARLRRGDPGSACRIFAEQPASNEGPCMDSMAHDQAAMDPTRRTTSPMLLTSSAWLFRGHTRTGRRGSSAATRRPNNHQRRDGVGGGIQRRM